MATLEGQQIKNSYKDLLQVSNSNSGVDGTLRNVEDGEGTVSALQLSSSAAKVAGNLTVTGNVVFNDGTSISTAPTGGSSLTISDEGSDLSTATTKIDFVGSGVTASGSGATKTITIPGGSSGITVQEEGSSLSTLGTTLNFVGSGVTASGTGATKTITVSSGGSSLTIKEEGSALSTAATSLDFVGAGVTASGTGADKTITIPGGIASLSADSDPTLAANLDVATFDIVTESGNRNVEVAAHGTGYFTVRGNTNAGKIMLNCESNSHGVSISSPPHSASATYDLVLPTSLSAGAVYTSSGGQLSTGDLPVADGGTGSSNASDARTALGVAIGSDVQAYDAGLNSIAGLTTAADKMIYTTGSDTYAVTTITAAGRAILDDADAAAQRTSLGLGSIATQASDSVSITGGSVTGITDLAIADGGTGASSAASALSNLGGVSAGKAIALAMIFGG